MGGQDKPVISAVNLSAASMPRTIQKLSHREGNHPDYQTSKPCPMIIFEKDVFISSTLLNDFDSFSLQSDPSVLARFHKTLQLVQSG
jgi:hypothetical protein